MFSDADRDSLRADLLAFAAADPRISGSAITGSAAAGREDQWSDIDLAFGVTGADDMPTVVSDFTARMYNHHHALHHVDVRAGAWLYRVFLQPNTLQVDLAFAPASDFRALAPSFRLVHGRAPEPAPLPPASAAVLIGMAWLYALHVRSAIARHKPWQALYMINGLRDHALALACLRHNLPTVHARGIDQLPAEISAPFVTTVVRELTPAEFSRAFHQLIDCLLTEIRAADAGLAQRLQPVLDTLRPAADQVPDTST